jgi:hypothetical protein
VRTETGFSPFGPRFGPTNGRAKAEHFLVKANQFGIFSREPPRADQRLLLRMFFGRHRLWPAYCSSFEFRKAHGAMPQRKPLVKLDAAAAG